MIGETLSHYRILSKLGGGGMGVVYEAEAAFRKVNELNPERNTRLGLVYLARAEPAAALQEMERVKDPLRRPWGLALAYHALGRKKEADAALAELREKSAELRKKGEDEWACEIAQIYAFRGEVDEAFAWLEPAQAQRSVGLTEMKGDPLLRNLEADPCYAAFLKKMRLPL